jgi:hypothetical protein
VNLNQNILITTNPPATPAVMAAQIALPVPASKYLGNIIYLLLLYKKKYSTSLKLWVHLIPICNFHVFNYFDGNKMVKLILHYKQVQTLKG